MVKTMNNNIKEHPIQFEADMIRALLQEYSTPGEHKNQTRRTCGLNQFNDLPEALKERGWEIQEFIYRRVRLVAGCFRGRKRKVFRYFYPVD